MPKRILVVEDNPMNLKLFIDVLEARGYQVLQAGTGREGLIIAERERPDLVLLDIQLPDISGLEVARTLKNDAALKGIPILAVTAFAMAGDAEKALAAGCDAYITKPIAIPSFLEQIRSVLGDG